jgi:hypothetical protein
MPLITDPRQIAQPLPASLMKEVLDGLPSGPSAEKRTRTIETEPPTKSESRRLEAEDGARPSSSVSACPSAEGRIIKDIWPGKYLVEAHACWSLSKSKVFHGELPVQSQATKELILQEAILWHAREQESEKWKAFQV